MANAAQTLVGIIRGEPRSRAKLELVRAAISGKLEYDTFYGRIPSPYQVIDRLDADVVDADPKVTAGLAVAVQQMLAHSMIAWYAPKTVPTGEQDAQQKMREQESGAVVKAVGCFATSSGIDQTRYRERVNALLAECAWRHR